LALAKRSHHNKPPTILDAPANMQWAAVDIPILRLRSGREGLASRRWRGCMAILNALSERTGPTDLPPGAGECGHDSYRS